MEVETTSSSKSPQIEDEKLRLEFERLRLERQKLSIETRLKKRELDGHKKKSFRETFSNPLLLAIVGGSLTLLTSIVTNYLTAAGNRDADDRRAKQVREAEGRNLQSELIKTFLKTPDSKTAKDNLTFLIESGLIPDHEERIKEYLANNTKAIPKISESTASSTISYPPCPEIRVGDGTNSKPSSGSIGVSLHLATNRLNPNSYGGWDGVLNGAVPDANSMQALATSLGYQSTILIDALARSDCLLTGLDKLSAKLGPGDTLLITMSGHGGQEKETSGSERNKIQGTWVLFDKQVRASEIYDAFAKFRSRVTLIVVQDISHAAAFARPPGRAQLNANLIVFAGSQENQLAMDGEKQGAFTEALLKAWNKGTFSGDYQLFLNGIRKNMPSTQTPQLYAYVTDRTVLSRKPFSLDR